MSTGDLETRAVDLLAFERAVLVGLADRIARTPSLRLKMRLCRWVSAAAARVRRLRSMIPAPAREVASEATPGPRTRVLMAAWRGIAEADAFLCGLHAVMAPHALGLYTRVAGRGGRPQPFTRCQREWQHFASLARSQRSSAWRDRVAPELEELRDHAARLDADVSTAVPVTHVAATRERTQRDPDESRTAPAVSIPAREHVIRALRDGDASEEVWYVTNATEYRRYLHQLIAFEISAFETCSRHIAEFASMPWRFHCDVAGQIGDELRHLEMWLERLSHAGGRLGEWPLSAHEYGICAGQDVRSRLGLLQRLVEASALDTLDLHRCLWAARDDRVMGAYLARVELDEIGHVRLGNEWLRRLCVDDAEVTALVLRAEAAARRRAIAAAQALVAGGIVPPITVDLVRRKFDDPLLLTVDREKRGRAGFSAAEIDGEIARRHAACAGADAPEGSV